MNSAHRAVLLSALLLAGALAFAQKPARAEEPAGTPAATPATALEKYLTLEILPMIFPGADSYGAIDGTPPSAPVYRDGKLVGYLFETHDAVRSVGFSKRPFDILVGFGLDGIVRGVRLVHHVEPIALLGRTDDDFHNYLTQFPGLDVRKGVSVVIEISGGILAGKKFPQRTTSHDAGDVVQVDAVSRTTTSSVLFSDAIVRSARLVARSRGIDLTPARAPGRGLDLDRFAPADWRQMIADGSIAHLRLTHGEVLDAFAERGLKPPANVKSWKKDETYLDLYMALATPAGIGVNILDKTWYDQYRAGRSIDDLLLLIMASGAYSFRGTDYEQTGPFDRIRLVQGERTIRLTGEQEKILPFIHAKGRPALDEISLFFLLPEVGLDPTRPWRLDLRLKGESDGAATSVVSVSLPYKLPERFIVAKPAAPDANSAGAPSGGVGMDWRRVWRDHPVQIGLLGATLAALVTILSAQHAIARRRGLHKWLRIAFLSWILVWLGWYAGAQVSVIHLLNVAQSLAGDFRWDFFLMEPLIFIIAAFVTVGLFLWGRAIFCGWLCPFGALQELLNKVARAIGLPQWTIPDAVQERLFAVKYLIVLGLLGLAFYAFDLAIAATAVEPFKAAITLRFNAPWPAVLYAVILLAAGLFIERFYCRFVCPLGAGLSILGRVRMFDWLKRRPECGNPCTRCESVCPVGAIKPGGEIDLNECFYCLDCQVMYFDEHRCPPLIARRKRAADAGTSPLKLARDLRTSATAT